MARKSTFKLEHIAFPHVGNALRKVRESRGLSLREWAKRIGVAHGTICKYESGELGVPVTVIERIAGEIGKPPVVVLAYLLQNRYPRITDAQLSTWVDELATEIESTD